MSEVKTSRRGFLAGVVGSAIASKLPRLRGPQYQKWTPGDGGMSIRILRSYDPVADQFTPPFESRLDVLYGFAMWPSAGLRYSDAELGAGVGSDQLRLGDGDGPGVAAG